MGDFSLSSSTHSTGATIFITFLKWKKPRVFLTFCLLFSIVFGVISSLFIYYPNGLGVDSPAPLISDLKENAMVLSLETEKHRPNHKVYGVAAASSNIGSQTHKENDVFVDGTKGNENGNLHGNAQELLHAELNNPFMHKAETTNFSRVIDNRLVHLDLKGSPPKLEYLKNVYFLDFTIIYFCSEFLSIR